MSSKSKRIRDEEDAKDEPMTKLKKREKKRSRTGQRTLSACKEACSISHAWGGYLCLYPRRCLPDFLQVYCNYEQIQAGTPYPISRDNGPRRRPIISSQHANIRLHAPPEKYFLGGCTYLCVRTCVDMTYDATIDTGGERNGV
jgi:hypothetical protein